MVVLTNDGKPDTSATSPAQIAALTTRDHQDIERYLDATRGTLLYARRVLLVEGPAELFLLPPLVKSVLNIDLEQYGVSVIPIYGTHFEPYARLFGPQAIPKRCAIVADGDMKPSHPQTTEPAIQKRLNSLENVYVKSFLCHTTFEMEITEPENLGMLAQACQDLGATVTERRLYQCLEDLKKDSNEYGIAQQMTSTKEHVLNIAKQYGKARFAQVASRYTVLAGTVPPYIEQAVEWLIESA